MNSHNPANIDQLEANKDENKVVEEQTMLMEIIKDKELIVNPIKIESNKRKRDFPQDHEEEMKYVVLSKYIWSHLNRKSQNKKEEAKETSGSYLIL